MDDRIAIAIALIIALLAVAAFLVARHIRKRKAFKLRQTGRGKSSTQFGDD
jgi:hypothetical protein